MNCSLVIWNISFVEVILTDELKYNCMHGSIWLPFGSFVLASLVIFCHLKIFFWFLIYDFYCWLKVVQPFYGTKRNWASSTFELFIGPFSLEYLLCTPWKNACSHRVHLSSFCGLLTLVWTLAQMTFGLFLYLKKTSTNLSNTSFPARLSDNFRLKSLHRTLGVITYSLTFTYSLPPWNCLLSIFYLTPLLFFEFSCLDTEQWL